MTSAERAERALNNIMAYDTWNKAIAKEIDEALNEQCLSWEKRMEEAIAAEKVKSQIAANCILNLIDKIIDDVENETRDALSPAQSDEDESRMSSVSAACDQIRARLHESDITRSTAGELRKLDLDTVPEGLKRAVDRAVEDFEGDPDPDEECPSCHGEGEINATNEACDDAHEQCPDCEGSGRTSDKK